jgi:hypothetical protein
MKVSATTADNRGGHEVQVHVCELDSGEKQAVVCMGSMLMLQRWKGGRYEWQMVGHAAVADY